MEMESENLSEILEWIFHPKSESARFESRTRT